MVDATYSISHLAEEFGITTRTIRFYEEKGLLEPARSGTSRIYTTTDRVKLKLIVRGKRLGFTLDESRDIIGMYDPGRGNVDQLEKLILRIQQKRLQLQRQQRDIEVMMLEIDEAEENCRKALMDAVGPKHQQA